MRKPDVYVFQCHCDYLFGGICPIESEIEGNTPEEAEQNAFAKGWIKVGDSYYCPEHRDGYESGETGGKDER